MTNYNERLEEILYDYWARHRNCDKGCQSPDNGEITKQALLDWHNKQVEEMLDRLSIASSYTDKQFSENPQLCLGKRDVQLAIEAERNKLKEPNQ